MKTSSLSPPPHARGSFKGAFATLPATKLGEVAIKGALARASSRRKMSAR
jgi:hypothetical protein